MNHKDKIENSIFSLTRWLSQNGWAGFDPYDIKGNPLVRRLTELGNKFFFFEIIRESLFELFLMYPKASRKVLRIKPTINPKALGLLAGSYIDLFKIYNKDEYIKKAEKCLVWLGKNASAEYPGKGWGYPFDWQSNKLIPANTPNGIVTTAVGDAYWKMYKLTNDDKYLQDCSDISIFLSNLPVDRLNENEICFSYMRLFQNHVHNLNMFVAEFLIKVGLEVSNEKWIKLGRQAVEYTVNNQATDGSFDYNGPPEKPQKFVDHYHTCFVLRQLHSIWELTGEEKYFKSLKNGFEFYIKNFFEDDRIPKFTPNRKYRIDIHSSAESINCLSELSSAFPQGLKLAVNVADWTIDNLQSEDGCFYHGVFKSRITRKTFISKIPYIRWGNAWMLKGLSNLLKNLSRNV